MAAQPYGYAGDPLERRVIARAIVVVALATTGIAFWVSLGGGSPKQLPGVALGSSFVLHMERALVLGAGVAALLMFSARGWVGYFPSKIGTGGAEYLGRIAVDQVVESEEAVHAEIGRLQTLQTGLARTTQMRLDRVEREVKVIKAQEAQSRRADYML